MDRSQARWERTCNHDTHKDLRSRDKVLIACTHVGTETKQRDSRTSQVCLPSRLWVLLCMILIKLLPTSCSGAYVITPPQHKSHPHRSSQCQSVLLQPASIAITQAYCSARPHRSVLSAIPIAAQKSCCCMPRTFAKGRVF